MENKFENLMNEAKIFFHDVKLELKNVTWPSREEVAGSTWVVLISVLLIGTFIWFVDIGLQLIVKQLL